MAAFFNDLGKVYGLEVYFSEKADASQPFGLMKWLTIKENS